MSKPVKVSYFKLRNCWKKFYKKRMYYLRSGLPCDGPEDQQSRALAIAEWIALKAKIDGADPADPVARVISEAFPSPAADSPPMAAMATDWANVPAVAPVAKHKRIEGTIESLIAAYLAEKKLEVETGKIKVSSYRENQQKLSDFAGYCKHHHKSKISDLDSEFLGNYRRASLGLINGNGGGQSVSGYTIKKRLAAVKRMMLFGYRNDLIDVLPRIIDAKYVECPVERPTPEPFSDQELIGLWSHLKATDNTLAALWTMMGLNSGYRSMDLSTLTEDMVREKNGRTYVIRTRSKTGADGDSLLWPETAALLAEYRKANPAIDGRIFSTNKGIALVVETMNRPKRDEVSEAFKRVRVETGGRYNHSRLRDTGSSWFREHAPAEIHAYLSHTRRDMSKHYASENYNSLFAASDVYGKHIARLLS